MSPIKEPHYYAASLGAGRAVTTAGRYARLFDSSPDLLRGEASVLYLSIPDAIPALLKDRPDARIIAIVRNPIDVLLSLHNHNLNWLEEDQADIERAWSLQHLRADGWGLPPGCQVPFHLQYDTICSFGVQIQRLYACVPERQRLVVVFDDLEQNPAAVYERICAFLNLANLGPGPGRYNSFSRHRSTTAIRLFKLIKTHKRLSWIWLRVKPFLNRRGIHLMEMLSRSNLRPQPRSHSIEGAFRQELLDHFAPDLELLEKTIGRDLSHWKAKDDRLPECSAVG
jgi:hypothetical protein